MYVAYSLENYIAYGNSMVHGVLYTYGIFDRHRVQTPIVSSLTTSRVAFTTLAVQWYGKRW